MTIRVNNGAKEIEAEGDVSLLENLARSGLFLPSACGGRGSCGSCKVKITSGGGPIHPTELPYLTSHEREGNTRLACQVACTDDIAVEVPDTLFLVRRHRAIVERISDVAHDTKELAVLLPAGEEASFRSGQYGQIEIPPHEGISEPVQRACSISSSPRETHRLEFLIRLVPGGLLTGYVHRHMRAGQPITVTAPFGDFFVRESGATMICVAGGSGMAPFRSIFRDLIDRAAMDQREIWYFYGARSKRDLLFLDWLTALEREYERFHFVPALSEPAPHDIWSGETGMVSAVLARYLESRIPSDALMEGYLCGNPAMLDSCFNAMYAHGMDGDRIYFDRHG